MADVDVALVNEINRQIQDKEIENNKEKTEKYSNLLFCKSLIQTMNGFNPEQNMEARIKIQLVLFEIQLRK